MKKIILIAALSVLWPVVCQAVDTDVDVDSNDALDVAYGGTNSTNGTIVDVIVKQADCSTITAGACIDTDNGVVYTWDGDSVELLGVLSYQPLEATLTDIADGTITENLVNTTNPWADNEVADDITASNYLPLAGTSAMTGELVVDELGIEGQPTDAITDCSSFAATGGGFFYDDSEGRWKVCQDNTLSNLTSDVDLLSFTGVGFIGYDGVDSFVPHYFDTTNFELSTDTWGIKANGVSSAEIATIVESVAWNAPGTTSDGTQCADAAKVTINSGPATYTTICTDNDASTIYGHVIMPDSWDGGTVTMESEYLQTAADTGALNGDIACMCRGAGEAVNNTWGNEIALDDAAVTGSNAVDTVTSTAMTCDGTCAAGDTLFWRYQMDATGTTTAVATLHFVGWKMEYTSNVGD